MQRWGPEVQTPGSRGPPGLCSSAFLSLEQALPEALPPARPGCPQEPRGRERLPWLRHPPQGPPRDTPWTRSSVQEATASCWVDPRVVNASTLSLNSRISWSVTGVGVPLAVCAVWGPGYAGRPPSGFRGYASSLPPSAPVTGGFRHRNDRAVPVFTLTAWEAAPRRLSNSHRFPRHGRD